MGLNVFSPPEYEKVVCGGPYLTPKIRALWIGPQRKMMIFAETAVMVLVKFQ
jgi:hypothetical protein